MKNKLIISSIYIAFASITFAIIMAFWVYSSLNTEKGFSHDYIKKMVVERFNNQNKNLNVDLKDVKLKFLDNSSTLGLRAQKLLIYKDKKPIAQMDNVNMSLSIWDIVMGNFPVTKLGVDGGRIIYQNNTTAPEKLSTKDAIAMVVTGSTKIFETMYELESVNLSNMNLQYSDNSGMLMVYRDLNIIISKDDEILDVDLLGSLNMETPDKKVIKTGLVSLKSEFNMAEKTKLNFNLNLKGIDNQFDVKLSSLYDINNDIFDVDFYLKLKDFSSLGTIGLKNTNIWDLSSADIAIKTNQYDMEKGGTVFVDGKIDDKKINGEMKVDYTKANFDLYGENITEEMLQKYWNEKYAPEVRDWMLKNIIGSYDLNILFDADMDTKDISNMEGTVILKDAIVDYYSGLPPLKVKKAIGQFDESKLDIDVKKATIKAGDENVNVSGAKINIFDNNNNTMMNVDMGLNVKWQNILKYLKRPAIGFKPPAKDLNIVKADTSGKLKLFFDLTAEKLNKYNYKGKLKNIASEKFNDFKNVKSRELELDLNQQSLTAIGKINFNEQSSGDMKYKYTYKNRKSDLTYNGIIDMDTIYTYLNTDKLQIDEPISAQIKYNIDKSNKTNISIKSDLTKNDFKILPLDWEKQINAPTVLKFKMTEDGNKNYKSDIVFKSESKTPIDFKVSLAGDEKGIKNINGKDIKYKNGTLNISAVRKNGYLTGDITAKDFYIDVIRYALENMPETNKQQKYDFNVKMTNLKSFDGNIVSEFSGAVKHNGKLYDKLILKMKATRPSAKTLIYYDKKKLNFYTNNLGVSYSVLFGGQPIKHGWVGMNGTLGKDGYISGRLVANDVEVLDVPESTRILKLFSVFGVFDALKTKNLYFNKIKGNFKLKDGIYTTDNVSALGKNVAISAKGNIDTNNETLELKGMVLPSYKLGSIFNNIPLLGALISGADGQGPITQKYTAKGGFNDYEVKVDSTGLFTVGILRDVFSILTPDESDDIKVDFEGEKITD